MGSRFNTLKLTGYKWQYFQYGTSAVLACDSFSVPTPEKHQVLVKVAYAGVNSADLKLRQGKPVLVRLYNGLFKPKRITTLGSDFSGRVIGVGEGVNKFKPGDRVFGLRPEVCGTHSEYLLLEQTELIDIVPPSLSLEKACASCFGGLNGLYFIDRLVDITSISKILVMGTTGSVGGAMNQLLRSKFASESDSDVSFCVLDRPALFTELPNGHYDLIVDASGKIPVKLLTRKLSAKGKAITTAVSLRVALESVLCRLWTSRRILWGIANYSTDSLSRLTMYLKRCQFEPQIDSISDFKKLPDVQQRIEKKGKNGAALIKVCDTGCFIG